MTPRVDQSFLRNLLACLLVAAHVAIPIVLIVVYMLDGLTRDELQELLQIVFPVVATLSAFGIAHIIATRRVARPTRRGARLSPTFTITTLFFTVGFVGVVAAVVLLKAWNVGIRSFSDLKLLLAVLQTVFGAVGVQLLDALFKEEKGL
jgi:hypothetical protein